MCLVWEESSQPLAACFSAFVLVFCVTADDWAHTLPVILPVVVGLIKVLYETPADGTSRLDLIYGSQNDMWGTSLSHLHWSSECSLCASQPFHTSSEKEHLQHHSTLESHIKGEIIIPHASLRWNYIFRTLSRFQCWFESRIMTQYVDNTLQIKSCERNPNFNSSGDTPQIWDVSQWRKFPKPRCQNHIKDKSRLKYCLFWK